MVQLALNFKRRILPAILILSLLHLLFFRILFLPLKGSFMAWFAHAPGAVESLTDGLSFPLFEWALHHPDVAPVFYTLLAIGGLLLLVMNIFLSGGIITLVSNRDEKFIEASCRHFFPFLLLAAIILLVTGVVTAFFSLLGLLIVPSFIPEGDGEWAFHIRWVLPAGLALLSLIFARMWFDASRLLRVVRPYAGPLFHLRRGLAIALRRSPIIILLFLGFLLIGAGITTLYAVPVLPYLLRWSLVFLYWGLFVRITADLAG